jgi:hypothetical protein
VLCFILGHLAGMGGWERLPKWIRVASEIERPL